MVNRIGDGNLLKPDDLVEDDLLEHVDYVLKSTFGWTSDFPQAISPCMGVPWIEAIVGCRVILNQDTIWAEPPDSGYDWIKRFELKPQNKWLQKLLRLHEKLASCAHNRFPVCLPIMHGPLDILSAFRSPEQFCLDVYDRPKDVKEAASNIAALWLDIAHLVMAHTPSHAGGWFTRMNLFMDGRAATPQADVTTLLSDQMYREFGLGIDQRIISSLPGQTYHAHSTSAHVLRTIARINNLRSLQVTIDPNGPPKDELKIILKDCQRRVPLLLAVWNTDDFLWALTELDPSGLAVVLIKTEMTGREEFSQFMEEISNIKG